MKKKGQQPNQPPLHSKIIFTLTLIAQLWPDQSEWQQTCANLSETPSLSALVVGAWQIGIELARSLVKSQLQQRAAVPTDWGKCPNCGSQHRVFRNFDD